MRGDQDLDTGDGVLQELLEGEVEHVSTPGLDWSIEPVAVVRLVRSVPVSLLAYITNTTSEALGVPVIVLLTRTLAELLLPLIDTGPRLPESLLLPFGLLLGDALSCIFIDALGIPGSPGPVGEAVVRPLAELTVRLVFFCTRLQGSARGLLPDHDMRVETLGKRGDELLVAGDMGEDTKLLGRVIGLHDAVTLGGSNAVS